MYGLYNNLGLWQGKASVSFSSYFLVLLYYEATIGDSVCDKAREDDFDYKELMRGPHPQKSDVDNYLNRNYDLRSWSITSGAIVF